jgi:hypothetical protein
MAERWRYGNEAMAGFFDYKFGFEAVEQSRYRVSFRTFFPC